MDIKEFLKLEKNRLIAFEKFWVQKNSEDPVGYPMSMSDDNSGLWSEMLEEFNNS
jgi:hypothetical protein